MDAFTLREMIIQGWPVLTVLMIMSIVSITVIVDRAIALREAGFDARAFVAKVNEILAQMGRPAAIEYCDKHRKPVAAVVSAVILQSGGREARERMMQHALQEQVRELETYVPVLGTVGSTAPYVGLLGTVIGIIKAFMDISANVGGGPEVVASGIAEALITTSVGLMVAIPAIMGYNYCIHKIQRIAEEIELVTFDVIEKLGGTGN